MKKLMCSLSAIAMAGMVQAATVDGSYEITGAASKTAYGSSVSAVGDSTTLTAYLFDAATWEGLNGKVSADNLANDALDSSVIAYQAAVGRGASQTLSVATKNSANTVGGLRDVSDDSWGATEDFYIVLIDNSKDPAEFVASSKQTLTTHGAADSANSTGTFAETSANLASASWGKVSSSGGVPEPTSGLLLALGGAMLALRRRRA